MTAAQLFAAAKVAIPGLLGHIANGDFAPLLNWLRTHVHNHGKALGYDELMTQATGRALEVAPFREHLESRYLAE